MKFVPCLLLISSLLPAASLDGYVGRSVCAGCHKEIAASQSRTAMSNTWQGAIAPDLPATYSERLKEGPAPEIEYLVRRVANGLEYQVDLPGQNPSSFAIEATTGGRRHGLSFLVRARDLDGVPLQPAPLIEARYLFSVPRHGLAMSPGFPQDKPSNYETAIGRVIGPAFQRKCLACHGEPRNLGSHSEAGVTCESCHGPGQSHLNALPKKTADKGILNPKRLAVAEQMKTCSQCHSGFSQVEDPMPDDLLISDQVTALSNSECWRQSGGAITCVNCHNPHQDAPRAVLLTRSDRTCLSCHSTAVQRHAAICPVNQTTRCAECHMPEDKSRPPFVISDHWIRVHPQASPSIAKSDTYRKSRIAPRRLWLRAIILDSREQADGIRQQLNSGASFFDLARTYSTDKQSGANGGFLGDMEVSQLNPAWTSEASTLQPGEISAVIAAGGHYVILQRMARDFREQAEARFNAAMQSRKQGNTAQVTSELIEALKIYPRSLRALTYLGITKAEGGDPAAGSAILNIAAQLYPDDAGAHFNLGMAYGAQGKVENELAEYKRAVEIDPDLVLAYLNWGAALYGQGKYEDAIQLYRQGINVNPLIGSLHFSLSIALERTGRIEEAKSEMALAVKIDPKLGQR